MKRHLSGFLIHSQIFICIAICTAPSIAQKTPSAAAAGEKTVTSCKQILAETPQPPAQTSNSLPSNCDSSTYYFGIGRPQDFVAARKCAYAERAKPDETDSDIFRGAGVLSMLYANGEGVSRDLLLARRFVCENGGAEAELEGRLALLDKMSSGPKVQHFDLCATATSGLSQGWCASVTARLHQAIRQQEINAILGQLPPAARPSFRALQSAEDTFDLLRSSHEVDLSGTGRAAFEEEEEDKLRTQFLINLQRVLAPTFASPVPLKIADNNLNAAYQALKTSMPPKELSGQMDTSYGSMGFNGVQETQTAWLSLRDAWIAFATALHGAATPSQVAAVITEQRVHQLKSLHSK